MILVINVKNTDNIIGLKEDIAMRLEGCMDVQGIGIFKDGEIKIIKQVVEETKK